MNIFVTNSRSIGSKSATAANIAPVAVGNAATIFSKTGTILVTTASKASTRFSVRFVISALALPSPAVNEPSAACSNPIEPEIVSVDSFAKLPAYCSVFSKNICIAISAFSACVAVFQVKSRPFARA